VPCLNYMIGMKFTNAFCLFLLVGIVQCSTREEPASLPSDYSDKSVYEGRIPLGEERFLYMEVTLVPDNATGDGQYYLKEWVEEKEMPARLFSESKGLYNAIYGQGSDNQVLVFQLLHSGNPDGVKRVYSPPGERKIKTTQFRKDDLELQASGENLLIVLDADREPITREPVFNLLKRSSRLFTVEGYLTHRGDTADFLEMNTGEKLLVAKTGAYEEAIRQYHILRQDKYEPIYLKAIGYTVQIRNSKKKMIDALVLKKLLQMTSAPVDLSAPQ
jgi:hypothetical protein